MDAFPLELLQLITIFTPRKDLPSLARTCSRLLDPSQQELYRHVTLCSNAHLKSTLPLLMRDDISIRVIELAIIGFSPFLRPNAPASYEMLKGLRNLCTLSIQNCPATFSTIADQGEFQQVLMTYCPLLRNLEVVNSEFIGPQLLLVGLQNVVWKEHQGPFTRLSLSLLSSSISTLSHLSIGSYTSTDVSSLATFCCLRFPKLSVLIIEPWGENLQTPVVFTQFLAMHSSIYHLELGCCKRGCCLIELDDESIMEDFLPELRTFKGHVMNIKTLASGRCQSLNKVQLLTAICWRLHGNYFAPEEVGEMFKWPDRDGVLSVLEKFVFMTNDPFEDELDLFLEWMETLANMSPLLRVWHGCLPVMMTLNLLTQVFSRFGNVREIQIFSWPVPEHDEGLKVDAARAIALQCPYLENFYFEDGDGIQMVMNFGPRS